MIPEQFSTYILRWFDQYGRKDLPWQKDMTPYSVWISEIMLQQTQVTTVIPYYQRFMSRFPNVQSLAQADQDEVLHYWTGLGYYARARNLHHCAQVIVKQFQGEFPQSLEILTKLPGIGRSTAGAILALSLNQSVPILDGNVKRVLCRFHAIEGWPGQNMIEKQLWEYAERYIPSQRTREYTQAMMDLGAMICTKKQPKCRLCPLTSHCKAHQHNIMHLIPAAKPIKGKPERSTYMLLIIHNKEILLEKRPPLGLWGGLWSLPECKHPHEIKMWCWNQLNASIIKMEEWSPFRHTFSHFHLDIHPILIYLSSKPLVAMEAEHQTWYNRLVLKPLGLSAPVKQLIDKLYETRLL